MTNEKIPFTLGYEALTLLGKGMYSNLWAALSELIANGIDAHADNVYVYIDMSNKSHSTIEILDDGDGMSIDEIKEKYVVIGNNKRDNATDADALMGRKGVGKLAALFLTKKFEFLTCKEDANETYWQFDFSDRSNNKPMLVQINSDEFFLRSLFNKKHKGTLLKLFDVNLTNMAEEAVNALSLIMANYFIYENLPKVKVQFFTKFTANDEIDFDKPNIMKKKVAFNNMIAILSDKQFESSKFHVPLMYGESFDSEYLEKLRKDDPLAVIPETKGVYIVVVDGEKVEIPYELKGWIGIHASINVSEAQKNDNQFIKNKYYNPNKLRLYIRNKLAVEDFMGYIKNTQQGANYIEGEISFDLLDDNRLEDITTSNRQDVDAHDPRVALLISIVKKVVTRLISLRNSVTEEVSNENKRRKSILESNAKKHAQKAIKKDLLSMGMDEQQSTNVMVAVGNKLKGSPDAEAKDIFKLFISHSKRDRRFSDFIYNLLRIKGAKECDIFYTTHEVGANSNLENDIKTNIAEVNELVLFLDSVNSMRSQYCMFEGGAFWATRAIKNCIHLHFDTCWIPDYINDTKVYHVPLNEGKNLTIKAFDITAKKYNEITQVLNVAIEHINSSSIHITNKIPLFEHVSFPTELELSRSGKTIYDYMDNDFVECWNYYVVNGETDLDKDNKKRTKETYLSDYNISVGKID
ncbi:MAG: hypothetical protein HFE40_01765 [Clostridia bacterium]|nr:hypothetical protein [Clostridia bacterium]